MLCFSEGLKGLKKITTRHPKAIPDFVDHIF